MERLCPCGKSISPNRRICNECGDIYGFDSSEWPEWLRWQVSDIQRELDFDLKHDYQRVEDVEPNGTGGYKSKPTFKLHGCRVETHLYQDRNKY